MEGDRCIYVLVFNISLETDLDWFIIVFVKLLSLGILGSSVGYLKFIFWTY